MKNKLLVSACLMGFQVRYNGSEKAQLAATLSRWQQAGRLVIHCPELAAWPAYAPTAAWRSSAVPAAMCLPDGRGSWKATAATSPNIISWPPGWRSAPPGKRAVRQRYSPTAALPAAASLSMTVPFADGAKRAAGVAADLLRAHGITVFSDGQIPQLLAWMAQKEQDDDSV